MGEKVGTLLSDWDGTAVETAKWYNPKNWFKIGLPFKIGYIEFLDGAEEGGLDIGGVFSKRSKFWRGVTTHITIANAKRRETGLDRHFGWKDITLAGAINPFSHKNERRKADAVIKQAKMLGNAALLDDKPHKIGSEIIKSIKREDTMTGKDGSPLNFTLAVVSHDKSKQYFDEFIQDKRAESGENGITTINIGRSILHLVQLEDYSHASGLRFASQMSSISQLSA